MRNNTYKANSALGVFLLCLVFVNIAHAALDQAAIGNTQGFIGAYAGLQNGSNATAGGDQQNAYLPGSFFADEAIFTTGVSSGAATQAYSVGPNANSGFGTAQAGSLKFFATNSASNAGFSGAAVHGGWNDQITIDSPGLTGTDAVWLFTLNISGSLAASGFAGSARFEVSAYKDNVQLRKDVGFFDAGASDPIATDRQQAQWGYSSAPNGSRIVSDTVTFAVPITYGDSFTLGVFAFVNAGKRSSSGVAGVSTATGDFLSTLQWGGTQDVLVNGTPVNGFTIDAVSGVDWVQAVPIPPAFVLLLPGVLMMWRLPRRRRI